MDAVDRTHLDAGVVLDAAAGDHIGHGYKATYRTNHAVLLAPLTLAWARSGALR
jgi:hypothetical protein